MQNANFHLLHMYEPKGTLLASVEVCSALADCVLLYREYLNKFCYCDVISGARREREHKSSISLS